MLIRKLSGSGLVVDAAAISLIILSSLLNYLLTIEYGILSTEIVIVFVFIIFVSVIISYFISRNSHLLRCVIYSVLLTLFIDFQFDVLRSWAMPVAAVLLATFAASWLVRMHVGMILLGVFATINGATVIMPLGSEVGRRLAAEEDKDRSQADSPILVHLILDEHIGIEGIPTDIPGGVQTRDALLAFFREYGFHVFGAAYSEYFDSAPLISSLLNFESSSSLVDRYYTSAYDAVSSKMYVLKSNQYFEKMHAAGYRIRVYQSTYIDYCRGGPVRADDCFTYNLYGVNNAALTTLSVAQRLRLVASMYGNLSFFVGEFRRFYERMRPLLGRSGIVLASWRQWDGRVSPISTMPAIDKMASDIESGSRGDLYFAHLLLPHYPYIYEPDCKIRRPILDWKNRTSPTPTAGTRAVRYSLYFEQVRCTLAKLRNLFDRMKAAGRFADATIIMHGDHGSRITVTDPRDENRDRLTAEDLVDGFSTLFAVKAPRYAPVYDRDMRSVTQIFEQVIRGTTYTRRLPDARYVYLRKQSGGWSRIPFLIAPHGVE